MRAGRLFLATFLVLLFTSTYGNARACSWKLYDCVDDVVEGAIGIVIDGVKSVAGGVKKRAKMVWNDPVGSILDPIKVIDEGIPSPLSIVEYTFKNPNEIINILENPVAGVVGFPVAMAITDGRNAALKNGTLPIPQNIRAELAPYFDESLLNSVRFTVGSSIYNGILQKLALDNFDAAAITLINVIVFKRSSDKDGANDGALWAHELYHVNQYRRLGLSEFAAMYTLSYGSVEEPADKFGDHHRYIRNTTQQARGLLVGLGGKCMKSVGYNARSPVVLSTCVPSNRQYKWAFNTKGEIKTPSGQCLDVRGGVSLNRTPLQVFPCNGTTAQLFNMNDKGEIRSALKKSLCVEVAGGFTTDGTQIQVYDCNGTASQQWGNPTAKWISSGLAGTNSPERCLRADSFVPRSLVHLVRCRGNDTLQSWSIERNTGQIRLIGQPGMCLAMRSKDSNNQVLLQTAICKRDNAEQQFVLSLNREIKSAANTNLCVHIPSGSNVVNSPAQMYDCINTPNQTWY